MASSRLRVCQRLFRRYNYTFEPCGLRSRSISNSSTVLAGHNKWSQIRHDKAKNDKLKSKERQLVSKEISSATQVGGPDPKLNSRLALALSNARRMGIPKAVIESAVARGQGKSVTGEALEQVTIEAMLPHSVAAVIECATDQKGRVLQDLRYNVRELGGIVTPTTYLFAKRGRIVFEKKDGLNPDDYLEQAIEAGAADISAYECRLIAFTEPAETKYVAESLSRSAGLAIEELEIIWEPNKDTLVTVNEEQASDIEHILNTLREDTSVRDIYLNTSKKL